MSWHPLKPVEPGTLEPCGSNASGSVREFFAHPADVDGLLRDGITCRELGAVTRWRCELTATPEYAHGIQVRAIRLDEVAA